eukprot:scaffold26885_cov112-Isochrysis_galbana.AAC.2
MQGVGRKGGECEAGHQSRLRVVRVEPVEEELEPGITGGVREFVCVGCGAYSGFRHAGPAADQRVCKVGCGRPRTGAASPARTPPPARRRRERATWAQGILRTVSAAAPAPGKRAVCPAGRAPWPACDLLGGANADGGGYGGCCGGAGGGGGLVVGEAGRDSSPVHGDLFHSASGRKSSNGRADGHDRERTYDGAAARQMVAAEADVGGCTEGARYGGGRKSQRGPRPGQSLPGVPRTGNDQDSVCEMCGGEGCLVDGKKPMDPVEKARKKEDEKLARVVSLLAEIEDVEVLDAVEAKLRAMDVDGALALAQPSSQLQPPSAEATDASPASEQEEDLDVPPLADTAM